MPEPNSTESIPRTDIVAVELQAAKGHLRQARMFAYNRQEPAPASARITLALDAVQEALDYRSET